MKIADPLVASLGPSPVASSCYASVAFWRPVCQGVPLGAREGHIQAIPQLALLYVSAPAALVHSVEQMLPMDARLTFVPWQDSGVGLLIFRAGDQDALVAILNLAGHQGVGGLAGTELDGRVLITMGDDVPAAHVPRVRQTMAFASRARRLSILEFHAAAMEYRDALLGERAGDILGATGTLRTLTIAAQVAE